MFDDVSFRYGPNLAGVFDLSFVVAAGKTVAFVGPSGSGKSTTARLACRLYDVAGGSVRVGGIDIRGVKQASLRRLTAVVAQETVLFNESVAFNIGYGLEGDDRERVVQAAKRAQLHDRVISWEDGYDTVVGERGLRLSGGAKLAELAALASSFHRPSLRLELLQFVLGLEDAAAWSVDRLAGALELAERVVVAMPRQSSFQELEGLTRRPDRGACD